MTKKLPSEEFKQQKISESKAKVTETLDSFKSALYSVLDEAVNPAYTVIEDAYKNAATVGDFAKVEILIQKVIAGLIEEMDCKLKRLIS